MDLIELADEMSCSARPDRGSFRRPPADRASKIAPTDLPDERPLTEGRAAGTADEPRTRTLRLAPIVMLICWMKTRGAAIAAGRRPGGADGHGADQWNGRSVPRWKVTPMKLAR